ncbi:type II 3-dehydroquinate dehydratase [Mesorhizobium sp. CA8]|uniref:type II 3-dehydroquinate dehydratase n=1 Tax=unclassified Mesorhizobium TaxID=325217 RepID=UPI001CC9042F|nr:MULTISPECIES: type II 3-dehydroquinate dehydratase [unclassified Mesorhizobium]MBZ9761713.1 type II 3-dehydroquinate dehydratase [Mesorhizobium sp. CA8]MBZ9820533.1 type II 3-dehydroquinate dehydratase [Mesorhizobium sp. CA4]
MRTRKTEWSISLIHARKRRAAWWGPIKSSEELLEIVCDYGRRLGVKVNPFTSESESELVSHIYNVADQTDAFLVNPATFTTYGRSFQMALVDTGKPYVECHFANLSKWFEEISPRQPIESIFTHQSSGMVMGLRHYSFVGALVSLVLALDDKNFLGANARNAEAA